MSFPARHPISFELPRTFGGTPLTRTVGTPLMRTVGGPRLGTGGGPRLGTGGAPRLGTGAPASPHDVRVSAGGPITALMELARDGRTAIVSVDCFDTILWRRTAKPTDVFVVLGEELRTAGLLEPGLDPLAFGRLRIAAEAVARRRKHARVASSEVDLGEIYDALPADVSPLSSEQLRAREVAVERRLTVPDYELCEALASLGPGIGLIVLSDTYLSAEELTRLIDRPGLGVLADARVFTSSELGSGTDADLWRRVSARLGVAPESIVHIGDPQCAVVARARAAGVRALPWAWRGRPEL